MLKRGLSLLIFLVLLSSTVCAFNFSTLAEPSPAFLFEGSAKTIKLWINNLDQPQPIAEMHVSIPNVNITNVVLRASWLENHTAISVRWFNDTVGTGSESDVFEFSVFVLPVLADTNVTLTVIKINANGSSAPENHTILLRNDTTPPVIASLSPANGTTTLANSIRTITADIQENQSQLNNVTYTYGVCNGTNTTIVLTCNGSTCTGQANFTSFDEGDTACYTLYAENNVGGNITQTGQIGFHGMPPNVTAVTPAAGTMYTESEAIYITANATDDGNVDKVRADITYPNGTTIPLELNQTVGNKYSKLFTAPNLMGQYNVTIVANDTSGNVNNTEITNFKIVPDYTFTFTLNPATVRPGRTVVISGTVKLSNGSNIPENQVKIDVQGTETNVTLTNGSFSHTFNALQNTGNYNIYVRVYANNGYNYSSMKRLIVSNPATSSGSSGWGWDMFEGGEGYFEDSGVAKAPEEDDTEDAGVAKAPEQKDSGMVVEEEPTPEEVIDEILSKPGNQITGSAVGLGTGTTVLAMILLILGLATLAYSNVRIRNHMHQFAKEKIGSRFKRKAPEDTGFSNQEWEEYFKRLKKD